MFNVETTITKKFFSNSNAYPVPGYVSIYRIGAGLLVCVFFTLNRYFHPSTTSTTSVHHRRTVSDNSNDAHTAIIARVPSTKTGLRK